MGNGESINFTNQGAGVYSQVTGIFLHIKNNISVQGGVNRENCNDRSKGYSV